MTARCIFLPVGIPDVNSCEVTRSCNLRECSMLMCVGCAGMEQPGPNYSMVQRNLALELVRVTEAAALASAKWLGKGDKNAADQAAVDMMRRVLNSIQIDGVVVIGEGKVWVLM